jgi:OOP family OmpA-OmpF porin
MKSFLTFLIAIAMIGFAYDGSSQIKVNLKKKIENQTNNRANQKTDQAVDKGLNKIEGIFKKKDNNQQQQNQGEQQNQQQDQQNTDQTGQTAVPQDAQPSLQAYSKYDFTPGEKVIFYEDFSQDAIGDFPALWNTNGSAEVVTTNLYPGNWMKFVTQESVWTDALLSLPDNYTIEFDVIPVAGENKSMAGWNMLLMQAKNVRAFDTGSAPGKGGYWFQVEYFGRPSYGTWLYGTECDDLNSRGYKEGEEFKEKMDQKYHIAIWVQKTRVRLYQDQNKLFDTPKAFPTGCVKPDRLRLENGAAMISNIRIAVGAPDMRNKLMTDGKLVTYGIYFDVNKDVVKPESYGTLKEIAAILNEVPDVKVKIIGHTDADGADAANLDLSKRRAASVKAELVKSFGVNGDRLVTDGLGESQPVAPNDTPVNKALNRRVEFIKL